MGTMTSSTSLGMESITCMMRGLPITGRSGLGILYVRGLSRVPMPPTRSTAFIGPWYALAVLNHLASRRAGWSVGDGRTGSRAYLGVMLTTLLPRSMTVPSLLTWSPFVSSVSSRTMFR